VCEITYGGTPAETFEDSWSNSQLFNWSTARDMRGPGSLVSIVSGYGLDDRAIEVRSPAKAKDFSSSSVSRPALGPTQPPVQWVPRVLSLGLKCGRGVTLTTHPHLVPRSRMSRSGSVACSGTALALARHMRSSVKCPCRLNLID
jgi:hypothetical protein